MKLSATRLSRTLSHRLGFRRDWYLVVLSVIIGLLMALVATAFIAPLRWADELGEKMAGSSLFWLMLLLVPAIGGLLVGMVRLLINAPAIGPGITTVIYSVRRKRGWLPLKVGVQQWINSSLTILTGGSAGAEGPIATIGGAIGSTSSRILHGNSQATTTLLGCGAAAGISAVFNAPIAGIFFVMEILLRDFSLRTFTPIVISSVVAAAATQGILHDQAIFDIGLSFAKNEGQFHISLLPLYLLLGILCGIASIGFIRGLELSTRFFDRLNAPAVLKPAIGGLLLGGLGLSWMLLTGIDAIPDFYGNGYPIITDMLQPERYANLETGQLLDGTGWLAVFLLGTFGLKLVGTCLTLGSGGAGGMFAPSLLMGASVGGAVGIGIDAMGWLPNGTPAQFALVGMAAVVAATTHAPLTAILIVYELTRSYEVIMPLMFAAVVSTLISRWLCRDSIYSAKLRAIGLHTGSMGDLTILRKLTVSDLTIKEAMSVPTNDSAASMLRLSELHGVSDFAVTDDEGHYAGLVTSEDLKAALVYREAIPLLQVNELQRSNLPTLTPDEPLDLVLEKFSRCDSDALVVLDIDDHRKIMGLVTRSQLMRRYQSALDRDE